MPIETVNLHVWGKCNLSCVYCYGTFPQRPKSLPLDSWCRILDLLHDAGVTRVTFSGGEPTLHPHLQNMLQHARMIGLQTSIITNGAKLTNQMLSHLDLVGLTLDSARTEVLTAMGRQKSGAPSYLAAITDICSRARQHNVPVKINTVVTTHNVDEDLTAVLLQLKPSKWKPLQFVHVPGENDELAPALCVDNQAFERFVARHSRLLDAGIWVAPETEQTVRSTYVMVDPQGRVFQHSPTGHVLSAPLLDVGLLKAIESVGGYDRDAFLARGGDVNVRSLTVIQEHAP